jgi:hypothetical protein
MKKPSEQFRKKRREKRQKALKRKHRYKQISLVLAVVAILSFTGVAYLWSSAPTQTEYNYEVKIEQVEDTSKIDKSEVTQIEELSKNEQKILYSAFKKETILQEALKYSYLCQID